MRNLGLLFYKEYFNNLTFSRNKPILDESGINDCIVNLFNANLEPIKPIELSNSNFDLMTLYPGLLIGSGYNHEIGEHENELKLGFFFDHATGLPCIPGSSVKGILRDACEIDNGNYVVSIIEELSKGERDIEVETESIKQLAKNFIAENKDYLYPISPSKKISNLNPSPFINVVFKGIGLDDERLPQKKRDIFFDAFPTKSFNNEGKFLANDYITHHENPFKDPNPVQFLKILPQVVFRFDFLLAENVVMNKDLKLELFRQILLDLGACAKTNVGYGQFAERPSKDIHSNLTESNNTKQKNKQKKSTAISVKVNLEKNESFIAKLDRIEGQYYYFKFSKEDKDNSLRKSVKSVYKKFKKEDKELKPGDNVIIFMQDEYKINSAKNPNFQILLPESK